MNMQNSLCLCCVGNKLISLLWENIKLIAWTWINCTYEQGIPNRLCIHIFWYWKWPLNFFNSETFNVKGLVECSIVWNWNVKVQPFFESGSGNLLTGNFSWKWLLLYQVSGSDIARHLFVKLMWVLSYPFIAQLPLFCCFSSILCESACSPCNLLAWNNPLRWFWRTLFLTLLQLYAFLWLIIFPWVSIFSFHSSFIKFKSRPTHLLTGVSV